MRNTREDAYATRRDYQQLIPCFPKRVIAPKSAAPVTLRFGGLVDGSSPFVAVGVYLRSDDDAEITIRMSASDEMLAERAYRLQTPWTRYGFATEARGDTSDFAIELTWPGRSSIDIWGLAAGRPQLPEVLEALDPTEAELNAGHVIPETYYLDHSTPWTLALIDAPRDLKEADGAPLQQKKCSFDSRYLPVDPSNPGRLAFHKHGAKVTNHQNECRSCKKWRINRLLNPVRTTSQLNESALLTRERKLLLREPEILASFKQEHGRGLKDHIWAKFRKACFRCRRPLGSPSEMDLDHTRPLAYLWPIDEHATALCPACNNEKRDRFPIDFYDDDQRRELAHITGLSLEAIEARALNPTELERILEDLPTFAAEWDPRIFASTARRIHDLRPELDLFQELKRQDPEVYEELRARLAVAPSVPEEHE